MMFGIAVIAAAGAAHAQVQVQVTVRNLAPANGAGLAPFNFGFHDGSFDAFNSGAAASPGVRMLAELGDGTTYRQEFAAAEPTGQSGVIMGGFGPGIFLPGATASMTFNLNPATQRFMSFGSMVVPSNDRFLGNDSPTAHQLFNAGGTFVGQTITLTAGNIWDAGSEVDQIVGAAFIQGQDPMARVAQNGVIGLNSNFATYLGQTTAANYTFSAAPAGNIAEISFQVIPAPAGLAALLAGGVFATRRRRAC
jgi:hypothetical protein